MLVRVVRTLTPEEVLNRIQEFEERYGSAFGELEDQPLEASRSRHLLKAYHEWADLVDAYRGYEEGGELDYSAEEFREFNADELALLTPKRIELLHHLANKRVESINELSRKAKRDVKNVYEDLLVMKDLKLVKLTRRGKRNVVPETSVKEIAILIR